MTPKRSREYVITDKATGETVHMGQDRRSILPNVADVRMQITITALGIMLTAMIGFVGYCGDLAYKGLLASIMDVKSSQDAALERIYAKMSVGKANRDNQLEYLFTQCGLICKGQFPPLLPGG